MTGTRQMFCLWAAFFSVLNFFRPYPKSAGCGQHWRWAKSPMGEASVRCQVNGRLGSCTGHGCLQRHMLLFLAFRFWLQVRKISISPWQFSLLHAICSLFTVGLFFRIASLKTPKVCRGMDENADIGAAAETSSDTLTLAVQEAGAKSLQTGKIPASPWSCSRVWAWLQRLTVAASSACRDAAYTDLCYVLTKIISFFKHKKVIAKITTFIPKAGLPDTRRVSLR